MSSSGGGLVSTALQRMKEIRWERDGKDGNGKVVDLTHVDLLLRFFQSQFFNEWIAIQ